MFIEQLSVFIENREGRLDDVLLTLKENDINIVSLSLADTSDFGVLRLIVNNPEKAKAVLKEKGFSARLNKILAIRLAHKVGTLQNMLSTLFKSNINIEYMYAISTLNEDAAIAFKASDEDKAVEVLKDADFRFITEENIKNM